MKTYTDLDIEKALIHFGILGMRWGVRKNNSTGISKSTEKLAKKDAKRFVEAKLFYGETAGTKRKLLKAELDRKKKQIPDYEKAFNDAVNNVNTAAAAKKAVTNRKVIDTSANAKRLAKNILGITGPLAIGVAGLAYQANKPRVDAFVTEQLKKYMP